MHEKSPSFSILKLGLCLRSEVGAVAPTFLFCFDRQSFYYSTLVLMMQSQLNGSVASATSAMK